MIWVVTDEERCSHCLQRVAVAWKSIDGHLLFYVGSGAFKGYRPNGSRVIDCDIYDSVEEAQVALVERCR